MLMQSMTHSLSAHVSATVSHLVFKLPRHLSSPLTSNHRLLTFAQKCFYVFIERLSFHWRHFCSASAITLKTHPQIAQEHTKSIEAHLVPNTED